MKFFRILDPFTLTLVTVVLLASFFPARGGFVPFFEHLTTAAIALLFFMHGAKLSREATRTFQPVTALAREALQLFRRLCAQTPIITFTSQQSRFAAKKPSQA